MSVIDYQNMLEEVKNKIVKNEFKYKNSIIVGDNSSGKSELLKWILEDRANGYYFIDSINRKFDYTKVSRTDNLPETSYINVVRFRVNDDRFNLEDSFDIYGTGMGAIEQVYFNFENSIKNMFEEFVKLSSKKAKKRSKMSKSEVLF